MRVLIPIRFFKLNIDQSSPKLSRNFRFFRKNSPGLNLVSKYFSILNRKAKFVQRECRSVFAVQVRSF
ncbi:hypothetical protein BES34_007035 [Leptospira inadai serovar Lyme]|uniref:Lipoprotein n=1 Tax=Leptospira inadai serovar Lyme TaxID=293084 RepID=A0ABX4YKS3_9LEPT|nr:hypothetical protein BES34_007035 [Leptospira inadai serovar Lyme]